MLVKKNHPRHCGEPCKQLTHGSYSEVVVELYCITCCIAGIQIVYVAVHVSVNYIYVYCAIYVAIGRLCSLHALALHTY